MAKTDDNVGITLKQWLNEQDTNFSGQGIKNLSQSMTHMTAFMRNTENILTLIQSCTIHNKDSVDQS
jgi:hypothetical protein